MFCVSEQRPIAVFYNEQGGIDRVRFIQYTYDSKGEFTDSLSTKCGLDSLSIVMKNMADSMRYRVYDVTLQQAIWCGCVKMSKDSYIIENLKDITRVTSDGDVHSDTVMLICGYTKMGAGRRVKAVSVVDWKGNVCSYAIHDLLDYCTKLGISVGNCDAVSVGNTFELESVQFDLNLCDSNFVAIGRKLRFSDIATGLSLQGVSWFFDKDGLFSIRPNSNKKRVLVPEEVESVYLSGACACEELMLPRECDLSYQGTSLSVLKSPRKCCSFCVICGDLEQVTLPEVVHSVDGRPATFVFTARNLPSDYLVLDHSKYSVSMYRLAVLDCCVVSAIIACAMGRVATDIAFKRAPKLREMTLVQGDYELPFLQDISLLLGGIQGDVQICCNGLSNHRMIFYTVDLLDDVIIRFSSDTNIELRLELGRDNSSMKGKRELFIVGEKFHCKSAVVKKFVYSAQEEDEAIKWFKQCDLNSMIIKECF